MVDGQVDRVNRMVFDPIEEWHFSDCANLVFRRCLFLSNWFGRNSFLILLIRYRSVTEAGLRQVFRRIAHASKG
jgi:hypothetical protein